MVFDSRPGDIMAQAMRIIGIVAVHFHAGAVIAVQSIGCGKTHKTVVILGKVPCLIT
jgi:hypothetical protein